VTVVSVGTGGSGPSRTDLELLPVPAIELTPDAHAMRANQAFARLTGIDGERLAGAGWFASLSPDRRPALFAALARREDFTLELRMLRADGVKAWIQLMARWLAPSQSYLCLLQDTTASVLAAQELQAEAQRFRLLADNVPALIAYYQRSDFTCVYANRQYAETFGRDPRSIVGLTFAQVIGEDAARLIQPQVDTMIEQRRTVSYVRELPGVEGGQRWVEVSLLPHQIGDGPVVGCFVLINDITRHRKAEIAARESEERLAKFMEASVEGIAFHKDGTVTDVNAPMAALVGLTPEQIRGRHVLEFIAPEHLPRVRKGLAEGNETPYEAAIVDTQGQSIAVEFIVRRTSHGGEELRLVVVRDVRDRMQARERIRQLAMQDSLTGLCNRGAFMEALNAALAEAGRGERSLALWFIDLDHFKRINDAYGHMAGDALLRAAAATIAAAMPSRAVAGRFGGDEFVIMLADARDSQRLRALAERLRSAMSAPIDFDGRSISCTPTIGIALYPEHAADADQLLRHADAALHAGKRAGRDNIVVYQPGMGAAVAAGVQLEGELAQALSRGEFELLYQPRLQAADGRLAAMQVLVRWNHSRRGRMAPAEFAGAAEHRHLLQPLASWALRQALAQHRRWLADGLCAAPMALDLGALHPHGMALVATVAHVLAAEPVSPGALLLELDEQILRDDGGAARSWLERLRTLGAGVMIDEFGAGGVSLSELRRLPLAGIKIDPTLVGALPDDAAAVAVVGSIIGLAHGLGMRVCASGVESGEQQRWLALAGCDQLQGAWAQAPMGAAEAGEWLLARRRA